jgi:hypothetical protein
MTPETQIVANGTLFVSFAAESELKQFTAYSGGRIYLIEISYIYVSELGELQ